MHCPGIGNGGTAFNAPNLRFKTVHGIVLAPAMHINSGTATFLANDLIRVAAPGHFSLLTNRPLPSRWGTAFLGAFLATLGFTGDSFCTGGYALSLHSTGGRSAKLGGTSFSSKSRGWRHGSDREGLPP